MQQRSSNLSIFDSSRPLKDVILFGRMHLKLKLTLCNSRPLPMYSRRGITTRGHSMLWKGICNFVPSLQLEVDYN